MGTCICSEEDNEKSGRFSIFQIIKFKNEPCVGDNRNGTCFTSAECDNVGGTESGSCADGFGVCCTVTLENGAATSLNQSYIVQAASALPAGSMQYTICPCSDDVCRIRFDFTQFTLNGPGAAADVTSATGLSADINANVGTRIGDCLTDTFSITSSSGGTPVICGTNGGQHMIVDTDGSSCAYVNFGIGGGAFQRNWDIMVTQYKCGEEAGGPPGCLQWHMAPEGKIRSFNFPDQAQVNDNGIAVMDNVVHLSNQQYSVCVRKNAATNHICYTPCTLLTDAMIANANMQSSFGVSIAPTANANSGVGSACTTDYVEIIGGQTKANAIVGLTVLLSTGLNSRYCGRTLDQVNDQATDDGRANANPVCTASLPFRVGVQFDADENTAAPAFNTDESFGRPGGIMGFALCYDTTGN